MNWFSKEQEKEIIDRYENKKEALSRISSDLGSGTASVRQVLVNAGITIRNSKEQRNSVFRKRFRISSKRPRASS